MLLLKDRRGKSACKTWPFGRRKAMFQRAKDSISESKRYNIENQAFIKSLQIVYIKLLIHQNLFVNKHRFNKQKL